jgi:hypothetical protein
MSGSTEEARITIQHQSPKKLLTIQKNKNVEKVEHAMPIFIFIFNTNNKEATKLHEKIAMMALDDMLQWLDSGYDNKDATSNGGNSNALRRALSSASNSSQRWS